MGKLKNFNVFLLLIGLTISFISKPGVNCDSIIDGQDVDSEISLRPIRQANPQVKQRLTVESLSLAELILVLMAKHGQVKTSSALSSLDNKSLGEVMRILLVEVDKPLAADIVALQQHAQNSDKQLVSVIARIVTGDSTVAKDIFMWDEKLRKFPWWVRIRQRMFQNLDKYVISFDMNKTKEESSTEIAPTTNKASL